MKKIITDADGCLFDWENSFHQWMREKGHSRLDVDEYDMHMMYPDLGKREAKNQIKTFNESAWMCCLPTFKDADYGISTLFDNSYRFTVITSLSDDPYAKKLRWMNLDNNFGSDAFDDLVCLETGGDKDAALEPYRDSGLWWIEDLPKNCEVGLKLGLKPILITHEHNKDYYNPDIVRADSWRDICDIILE